MQIRAGAHFVLPLQDHFRPPAPPPLAKAPGPLRFIRILRQNPIAALTEAHFEQPIVFTGTILGQIAVVSDPSAIRRVLVDNCENYRRERFQKRMMELPFGANVLAADGDEWRTHRRRLAPAFTPKMTESFATGTAAAAAALVERWLAFDNRSPHDIAWELDRAMVDLLERTLFTGGLQRDADELAHECRRHYTLVGNVSVLDFFELPFWIPRLTHLRHRPVHRYFERMAEAMIGARERLLAEPPATPPYDLLSALLQDRGAGGGATLSRDDIRANIVTLFAAAEPIAAALSWTLYLLSRDPQWRERVEEEADRELPAGRCVEGSLQRLVATRAVIEESLRLYPPIATIHREAISADQLAGHAIAPKTVVIISPWLVHRHRLLWATPDRFNPSRFLPPARANVARFAYLPFGMGPRTCIGGAFAIQSAIILLATIVRRLRLEHFP